MEQMYLNSHFRISGWLLPCGNWIECKPWEHIKSAKDIPYIIENKNKNTELQTLWDHPDEELLRAELAKIGMVKVCYYLIDADYLTHSQLQKLQDLYTISPLDEEIEFIGRIRIKIQVRLFLKIKDPDRLNKLF
jgi:hypothetical protein